MKRNYIPAFITLLAGFITCILGLKNHYSAIRLSLTLFVVLVCFYILGCFVKSLICHFIPEGTEEEEVVEEENAEGEATEDEQSASDENEEE